MAQEIKVMIVDDEPHIGQLLNMYLRKEGYQTTVCTKSKDALNKLHDDEYDIVLLDWMMPVMDGMEMLAEIRKFSHMPVIMLSGKDKPVRGAADDFIVKPFDPQDVVKRVKALLKN